MSAHVLLNLLNELRKRDKMLGLPSILSLFCNNFSKYNKFRSQLIRIHAVFVFYYTHDSFNNELAPFPLKTMIIHVDVLFCLISLIRFFTSHQQSFS